ncbi:MAG TPA: heterodisulfide reductase-related iron-sulfur binding cluster [bacterium]|nr:heterodisulfide reductase-related iron-sulfur binding cluster [bacterium]
MSKFDYGRYYGVITPLADALRTSPTRFWEPTRAELSRPHEYVLYLGCNVLRTVHLAEAIVAVLRKLGVDFVPMGGFSYCCGIVHERNGDDAVATALTQQSLNKFKAVQPRAVLVYCPSCHSRMDRVLPEGDFGFEVPYLHVTQFIAERLHTLTFPQRIERRIALHTHSARGQSRTDARNTATILRAIPGLEVVELTAGPEWGYHCAPQQVEEVGPERFDAMVDGMFAEARAQGCDGIAAVYHSCYRELLPKEAKHGIEFLNYVELLAAALGLGPFPARYKALKLAGDPEAAYAELEPRALEQGNNPARLRRAVQAHFAQISPAASDNGDGDDTP